MDPNINPNSNQADQAGDDAQLDNQADQAGDDAQLDNQADQASRPAAPIRDLFGVDAAPAAAARKRGRPRKVETAEPEPAPAAAKAPEPRKRNRAKPAAAAAPAAGQKAAATIADAAAAAATGGATEQAQLVAQLLRMEGGAIAQLLCQLLGWAPLSQAEQEFVTAELEAWTAPEWLGRALMWASIIWPRVSTDARARAWFDANVAPRLPWYKKPATQPLARPAPVAQPQPQPAPADVAELEPHKGSESIQTYKAPQRQAQRFVEDFSEV